jgi:hypothetical protein
MTRRSQIERVALRPPSAAGVLRVLCQRLTPLLASNAVRKEWHPELSSLGFHGNRRPLEYPGGSNWGRARGHQSLELLVISLGPEVVSACLSHAPGSSLIVACRRYIVGLLGFCSFPYPFLRWRLLQRFRFRLSWTLLLVLNKDGMSVHVVPSVFCLNVGEENLFNPKKSRRGRVTSRRQRQQVQPTSNGRYAEL